MAGRDARKTGATRPDTKPGPDDARAPELSPEVMAAIAQSHSGLAEICIQEWAILLRCNVEPPVKLRDLVASLLEWFPAPLSAPEISGFIERLNTRGFLLQSKRGRALRTTPLGEEVLRQCAPPLIKGMVWVLTRKDEDNAKPVNL